MENSISESINVSNIEVIFEEVKPERSRVRVGTPRYSKTSIGVLVEVILGPKPNDFSAARLEWFPKSLCEIEEVKEEGVFVQYFLTAPDWLLKEKKVSCEKR